VYAQSWWMKKWQGDQQEHALAKMCAHSQECVHVPEAIGFSKPEPPLIFPYKFVDMNAYEFLRMCAYS